MTVRRFLLRIACFALAASASQQGRPLGPMPSAVAARSTLILAPVAYGSSKGVQLSRADDACGVPEPLHKALQERLKERHQVLLSASGAANALTPALKIEIMDIVTVSAGGPVIVRIHAVLERAGLPAAHFKGLRQMRLPYADIKADSSECSAMDGVIRALSGDVAEWMLERFGYRGGSAVHSGDGPVDARIEPGR